MDDAPQAAEAVCLGPSDHTPQDNPQELPAGFVPLRLLLQPGGLSVELAKPDMIIGRHSSADIRLCLPDVSRRHCRCVYADRRWKVIDLGSLNGTLINDQPRREAILAQGDRVRIGSLTFAVDLGRAAPTVVLPSGEDEGATDGVLQSIADVLPPEQERRKAS
jgi:pSer/pThr/pTyr-binding forkhead associated (FHA) protein